MLSNLLELLWIYEHTMLLHSLIRDYSRHVEMIEEFHQGLVLLQLLPEYPEELILIVDIISQVG